MISVKLISVALDLYEKAGRTLVRLDRFFGSFSQN
jgi:hypothetical protein